MEDTTSPALNRTLDTIGECTGPTNYGEWGRNLRQAFGLYALDMLKVLDGTPCPEEKDVDGEKCLEEGQEQHLLILLLSHRGFRRHHRPGA